MSNFDCALVATMRWMLQTLDTPYQSMFKTLAAVMQTGIRNRPEFCKYELDDTPDRMAVWFLTEVIYYYVGDVKPKAMCEEYAERWYAENKHEIPEHGTETYKYYQYNHKFDIDAMTRDLTGVVRLPHVISFQRGDPLKFVRLEESLYAKQESDPVGSDAG